VVGLGCLGLFILGVIGSGVAAALLARKAASTTIPAPGRPVPVTAPAPIAGGVLSAELRDVREFKSDFDGLLHFIGEIHNVGDAPLGFPSVKITFYDASKTAVSSTTCGSLVRTLLPGQKVPCSFMAPQGHAYVSYATTITPMAAPVTRELPTLNVTGVKFTPRKGFTPHQLEGKVTNASAFTAKQVWVVVSLYGADGKIVGADQALVAGADLPAAASALFSAKIFSVAAKPETYSILATGQHE
jgi:hypothetical protein